MLAFAEHEKDPVYWIFRSAILNSTKGEQRMRTIYDVYMISHIKLKYSIFHLLIL